MTSPGQDLKKEREARGISLKAIADATRITQRYLEAVESDRLDLMPGGFFIKGILRAYAGAVGLDEEAVLEGYRRAGVLTAAGPDPSRKSASEGGRSKKRTRFMAGAAATLIVVASFAAYFLIRPGKTALPPSEIRTSTGAPERSDRILPETEAAPAAVAPQPEKGIRFEISFNQETWIQVYADGRLVLDGIRKAGNTAEIRAETELLIHLGNAGGLSYTLNGKRGKPFGSPGAVVKNIRITEADLASFVRDDGTGET
jgi:cytoskeletal protein RodZ